MFIMELFKQRQVNWQDGMKLNKNHFVHADNYHIGQLVFSRNMLLNENNFGMLPSYDKTKYANQIDLSLEGDFLHITKFRIAALMLNGMAINVDSNEMDAGSFDIQNLKLKFRYTEFNETSFVLILKTNAFKGLEYGNYDSEDFPLKRPFLIPFFEFILVPESEAKKAYFSNDFFVVMKFQVTGNQVLVDEKYIPPVTAVIADKQLTEFHLFVYNSLNSIENYLLDIAKKHVKNKTDNFSETLVLMSAALINHISAVKYELKHKLIYAPPIDLIIKIKSFANILHKTIEMRTSVGKDMFLNEVNRITGIPKHEFEELLKQITNLEYRHHNIIESVELAINLVEKMVNIFRTFSEGDQKQKTKQFDIKIKR